jgi:hypothetical protein
VISPACDTGDHFDCRVTAGLAPAWLACTCTCHPGNTYPPATTGDTT